MKQELVEREWTSEGPGRSARGARGRTVTVNVAESPLTWLHARGHLDDRELAAGELLRRDYEAAQLVRGMTMRWEPKVSSAGVGGDGAGGGLFASERQMAARQRFDAAVASAGQGLADVLWRVVCAGEALPTAERALGWPARSGKLVLRFALQRLVQHYRIP